MIKLIIKNPNGSIETKMLSHDLTFTPKAGQQFYFDNSDGSRKYTFNLADGEKSIELIFAGNAERLKFNLNGMADLIKQSDLVANENKKTVLGIMNDEDGLKELNQTALNDNFQGDKVISELKQLLDDTNNPDEKYQNGIIIDDFGALAEQLDAAAAGAGPLGQNSGTTDDVIPTSINTYAIGARGVGDTLDRSYPTVDLQGTTTDETPIPVYAVISGTTILSEGVTANYIIKLIDIDGNEVTVSQDTIVKIKFENITTQDDDTEYSNNQIIEVTIKAGSSSTTLDVKTLDDLFAEEDEDYKLTIDSVDSTEFDDLRIEDFTSTTGTNYSITAETTITDEPEEEDDKVFVQLLGDDSVIEADGAELTHTIKLVDEQGNAVELPAGKTITLTLTYTPDATDGTEAEDFTSDSLQTTVTISGNGGSEYTITNTVVDDAWAEDIESYTVTLTNVSDDNNYFEDLSVDATQTSAIGSIVDENTPPAQPQVSVDLEVDPGNEVLTGTANTSSVDVTITDESGNVIYTATNVVVVNGVWDLTNDSDFTALVFNEDEDYTATVTGEINGVQVSDSDVDDYTANTPNEPSVSVDLEVDPGAEKLVGTTDDVTNSVEVSITDESGNVIYTGIASVNTDGTWDLSNDPAFTALEFNDEEEYTATAVATNTNGLTANDSDVDEYKEADTAYSLKLFAVVEIANPNYDPNDPNSEATIKTYVDANTVVEGSSGTYVVLAVDENGTPLATQPGGTITVKTGIDSDSNTEDAVRGSDYDSITDALNDTTGTVSATVGIEFTIDTLDDIYAEEDENFILTLQEDWSEASNYEVIEYDKTPVTTTITDEPEEEDDKVFVQLLGDDSVIEADGAELTHTIKLVDEQGNAVELPAGKTITLTLTYTPDATDGTEAEDFTSDSLQTTVTISGNGGSEYTITNTVVDDAWAEDIESYTVTLTNVSDDNNYFEDLSVDATQTSAIGSIVDENTPPAQPQVSVDLEVDPGNEVLTGTANTSSVDVTITDESGNVIYTATNVVVVNGVWDLTNDSDFTALVFNEDEDYTATVTGEINGVQVSDSDVDDYTANTPNEPSVSVDLEVDPGAEKLVGTTDDVTNSVEVSITDESGNVIYTGIASVNTDGTWDLSNDPAFTALEFNDEEEYTATAVATNTNGLTANDSDVDEYKEADTAYSLKLFAVVEIANPNYDPNDPNSEATIKTYVDANTVVEGSSGTYVVLAVDENGTPLATQPGGTITVKTGIDSDSNTEDAVRGSDYDSITDALNDTTGTVSATVGIEFTIDTLDDIYAEEDENFILTLQEDWSEASNYEVIEYDKTPVTTTITDNGNHSIAANDDTITVCFTSYEAQAFNGNNFTTGNLGDEDDIGNATLKWNSQNQQVVETDLGLGVYGNINSGTTGTSDSLGIDDDETLVIKLSNPVEQAVFQINADVTDEMVYGAWTLFDENGEQVSVNTFFEIDSSGMLILSATDVNGDPVSFQYVSFEGKNEDQTASDLGYYVQPYGVDSDLADDSITIDPTTGAISVTILVSTILANDTDSDGDNSSLEFDSIVINSVVGGTTVYNNDGTITFTKDINFDGIPSFDYSITDSDGNGTSSATVTLSSDCSLILRNPYFTTEDGYENILAEDSVDTIDGIDDGLNSSGNVITDNNLTGTVTLVNGAIISNPIVLTYGTLTMNEDGSFDYVVDNNSNEVEALNIGDSLTETFTYTLSDGTLETATIVIEGRDDAPIIQNITTADVNLNNDASIKYTLDVDGDGATDTLSQSALLVQDRGLIYEEDNGNLQIDLGEGGRDVAIEYHGGQAGLNNIFGYYELDANGNPTNFQILYVEDGTTKSTGGSIDLLEDLSGEIGFFLIPGGYNNSAIMDLVTDGETVSSVVNLDGSDNATITFTDGTVIEYPIYFTDNNLSSDGRDHAIAGISEDGTGITIGFEDLPENSTDQDYDDFVFTIKYCDTTGDNGQLFTNVNFTDVDDANLTSATVTLNDAQVGDTLSIDLTELPTGINAAINGNIITFTNIASLDDYEDAIEAIRFATTSQDRSTREFEIEISDGIKTDSITKTVNIIGCELEPYSPVYIKVITDDSVTEGNADNTLTHKVILVDAAGNAVTVPDGESVTATLIYTDGTGLTNDDFTTNRQITVTINGGESEATITNYVKDDAIDENTESYVVEIVSIDNNPFDTDLINTGTSAIGTIEDDDTITITVDPDGAQVDEDFIPNIGNATDPDTDLVDNQYTDSGNILTTGGVIDVIFASGQTTTLTSQGAEITLTTSADGKTIAGTSGTTPIFTVTISADGTSYDFVLQGNIDHPNMNIEDTLDLSLKIEATNGTNTVEDILVVTIADDLPCANDKDITVDLEPDDVNLVFTLDISGSMGDDVSGTNQDKLEIAIDAIKQVIADYEALGRNVNVQINTFSTTATGTGVWMNGSQLSIFLDTLHDEGWTNYEDALAVTEANYINSTVPAGTTYAYFLSDGDPTVEINDDTYTYNDDAKQRNDGTYYAEYGEYIDPSRKEAWDAFVTNNVEEVFAVGIGTNISTQYLNQISDTVIMVDDPADLVSTLQDTVVYETGSLDFCFGADGAADGIGSKLDGDKLPFTWETPTATDVNGAPVAIVWTITGGTVLVGTINGETVVKIEATDIFTDNPKYVITELDKDSGIEDLSVPYTVTDGDGDSQTATLNIDVIIPVDDVPTISVEDVLVDEDALPQINTTDTDGYNNVYTETKALTYDFGNDGAGSIQFVSGQTTSITAEGQDITLQYSNNNQTITGVDEDGTAIFTISLDVANSQYTFTLLENVDHPTVDVEDLLTGLSFDVEIVDGNGTRVTDTINVEIADDIVTANDSNANVDLTPSPVNLVFTLDVSGSMGDNVSGTSKDKLEIAIEAIENVVAQYESQGREVLVQINTFSTSANGTGVWMNASQLSTFLDTLNDNGWTNYEDALQTTEANYIVSPNGGDTYVYFLSDGNPTVEMNDSTTNPDDITSGNTQDGVGNDFLDSAYENAWNSFIADPSNNITGVYAVGIGTNVNSYYLSQVSSNVIEVDNPADLVETLQDTVVYESGTLDIWFGADGFGSFEWETPIATDRDGNDVTVSWTLVGHTLTGTIAGQTVVEVEANVTANGINYEITQLDKNSGITDLKIPYKVTDGDGDSTSAYLNIEINTPIITAEDVITCEDTTYTFVLTDFGTNIDSIQINTLPTSGTLYLGTAVVSLGITISATEISNGELTFVPDLNESGRDEYNDTGLGNQQNDYAQFSYTANDGAIISTMTIDVSPVADAPTLSVLGIVGETTTIDVTNVTDTSGGYSVSAYYANGTAASISIVSGTTHDGFGVQSYVPTSGDNPGAATEISYQPDSYSSESIVIKFDNEIGSVDISYAWKHSYDSGDGDGEIAIVQYYKDGVLLHTEEHYDPNQTDTVDGPYTFALSGGESFDEIRISAKQEGDDFLIHSVTFTEIETSTTEINVEIGSTFDFEISSSLFDTDGSESLVSILIDNIPEGMILSDGINTFTSSSSNDSVDVLSWDLDAIKITVPSDLTAGDYDLLITAKSQESLNGVITPADPTLCPLEAETSTTFKVIVSEIVDPTPTSISESQDMDVCLMDTNLVITLDVSGSMTNDNGWIDTNGDGHGDTTRLQLAKDAIIEMINKYSLSGTVMVQLTLFDSNAQTTSWMSATDAIAYITAISAGYKDTVDYNQMTDYETAINSTVDNYKALNNGAQTIAYFISDGSPTKEFPDGDKEEYGYLDSQYATKWTNFVNSIDGVHAVGIGSGVTNSSYLETMSVGTGAEYTDDLSIDSTLTNGIGDSVTGNLLDNIIWGVDSNGNADVGTITSIIIDGVTYNATDYTDSYTFNTGQGEFEFNFTTGDYIYTNTESDVNNDYSEVIYLKATDSTGDETTYNLTVNVTLGECTVSNPTPTNVILTDNEVVITDNCHNTTITSVSTSYTVYDSDDIDLGKFVTDGARNIDSISLEGNSTTDILNVDLKDVIDLTDSDNQLKIFGDSDDKVVLDSNSTWTKEGTQTIDGDTFNVYRGTDGASNIKILIDTDVSVDPDL